jgi:hypothetical protein
VIFCYLDVQAQVFADKGRADCCKCPSHAGRNDYDACDTCVEISSKGCAKRDEHVLYKIASKYRDSTCRRLKPGFWGSNFSGLKCDHCFGAISRTGYYRMCEIPLNCPGPSLPRLTTANRDCCECNDDDFDICSTCYEAGKRCPNSRHYTLLLLPEPRVSVARLRPTLPPLTCPRQIKRFQAGRRISCNRCDRGFDPVDEPFFRTSLPNSMPLLPTLIFRRCLDCCSCDENYDVCVMCVKEGHRCPVKEHDLFTISNDI